MGIEATDRHKSHIEYMQKQGDYLPAVKSRLIELQPKFAQSIGEIPLDQLTDYPFADQIDESTHLDRLRASILHRNKKRPIIVTPILAQDGQLRYLVVDGRKRVCIAGEQFKKTIPVEVKKMGTLADILTEHLYQNGIANKLEYKMDPIAHALTIKALLEEHGKKGVANPMQKIVNDIHTTEDSLKSYLRLLDMPKEIQKIVRDRILSIPGFRVILAGLKGHPDLNLKALAGDIREKHKSKTHLSPSHITTIVKDRIQKETGTAAQIQESTEETASIEEPELPPSATNMENGKSLLDILETNQSFLESLTPRQRELVLLLAEPGKDGVTLESLTIRDILRQLSEMYGILAGNPMAETGKDLKTLAEQLPKIGLAIIGGKTSKGPAIRYSLTILS